MLPFLLTSVFQRIEPVILFHQFSGALFDTALQMTVKDRCSNATGGGANATSTEDSRQKAMSNFYMTYNLLAKLGPILPSLLLARLGDRGWRKAPIVAPLTGYLLSRLMLLLVILLHWPLEVMWAGAILHGLFGGFCSYWAGIMTLVSLGSTEQNRSRQMMRVELLYGVAGLVGSLVSGHLFQLHSATLGQGTILVGVSAVLYLGCLLYSIFLLQVRQVSVSDKDHEERSSLIVNGTGKTTATSNGTGSAPGRSTAINLALLFAGGILYDMAVGGGMEILISFEMKEPLNWNATQVGYGNAAGFVVFLTSFLGVMVMSRCVSDVTLIIIGMLSFATGIYFMAFVTATYLFYLARSLTLFALIPMPTIRSLLSQQVHGSSYGITLTSLQLAFKLSSLAYTPAYTKIYQSSLSWFPGLVFILSSIITVFATIPISVAGCLMPQRKGYVKIQGNC